MRKLLSGRAVVFPSTAIVQSIALLRNLAVARIIGPEQFGIAAVFILVSQFLDLTTDTGLNKFLLSHRHGQKVTVQASVQYVALIRGFLISAAMLAVGYPALQLMSVSPTLLAIIVLATLPIAVGSLHYDNARLQQKGVFFNDAVSQVFGEVAGIAVTVGVALETGSYLAVLVGLVARALGQSLASHILADRPYQLRLSLRVRKELVAYSTPLLLNGFVLFFSMQSDRALVAVLFTPLTLGVYAAAMQLLTAASTVLTKTLGATFLPTIARAHLEGKEFEENFEQLARIVSYLAISMMTSYAALGPWLIPTVYGHRFSIDVFSVALVGIVQGIRLVRVWPSTVALAIKRTKNVLVGNLLRLSALPIAALLVVQGWGLNGLLVGYGVGEFFALCLTLYWLPLPPNPARPLLRQAAQVGATALAVLLAVGLGRQFPSFAWLLSVALLLAASLTALLTFKLLRGAR